MAYRFKTRSVVPGAYALTAASLTHVPGYPAEADVKDTIPFGTSGTEYTGSYAPLACDYPSEDDVRDGVTYDTGGFTGNMTLPLEANVHTGITYGTGGVELTGNLTHPAIGDVRSGTTYGAGGVELTGNFEVPAEADVVVGISYGALGTEYTGTYDADSPAEADVRDGTFYAGGLMEGNLTLPTEPQVQNGVAFGAAGTEYTGTMVGGDYPAEGDVRDGVVYATATMEGNLEIPTEAQVRNGVGFGTLGTEYTGTLGVAVTGDGTRTIQKLMAGLYATLYDDDVAGGVYTLTEGRIYESQGPQDAQFPLVVFALAVATPLASFTADTLEAEIQVDCYTDIETGIAANRTLADRVIALWNRQTVVCTDWNHVTLLKLDDGINSTEDLAHRIMLRFRLFGS